MLAVLAWAFGADLLQALVRAGLSEALGRPVAIEGPVAIGIAAGGRISLSAAGTSIAGAPGAPAEPPLFRAETITAVARPWPLLRGHVALDELTLVRARLSLVRLAGGEANWSSPRPIASDHFPSVAALHVEDGAVTYVDPARGADMTLAVASGQSSGGEPVIRVRGEGRFADEPATLSLEAGSRFIGPGGDPTIPVQMETHIGATRSTLRGGLRRPLPADGFELDFGLEGPDMAKLFRVIGIPTPPSPPYRLDGKLQLEGTTWRLVDISGKVGGSDVRGSIAVDTGGARGVLRATLESRHARLVDLARMVGLHPETAAAGPPRAGVPRLPDADTERLRAIDAEIDYRAALTEPAARPLEALSLHLTLERGRLRASPLRLTAAGGTADLDIVLDASTDRVTGGMRLDARAMDLGKLLRPWGFDGTGRVSARASLDGPGGSAAAVLAQGDGSLRVTVGEGRISRTLIDLAGQDLVRALDAGPGDMSRILCGVADFALHAGKLAPRSLVLHGERTVLTAGGVIDLRDGALHLRVTPHPRRAMAVAPADILIEGPLWRPHARVGSELQAGASALVDTILSPLAGSPPPEAERPGPAGCPAAAR